MPAVHGDLAAPVTAARGEMPATITPRQVALRDRVTIATLVPFSSANDVPRSLLRYLSDQFNKEIEKGDTYAMTDPFRFSQFGAYWFSHFGAIMLLGNIKNADEMQMMDHTGVDWTKACLGSFNVRPNYPGRSSHICNAMFLVTDAARNKGVGRLMGEGYLEWAPKLGYTYAMFNLVYESNVASCRLWDSLGFKRIGRVPGGGRLRSHPGQYVDAIIYGRDLGGDTEDSATQDRFDKIRYYLKYSKYPRGADRAEKSRLRSAATHYKLTAGQDGGPEKLMLKDKEVVSDPQQQYEIARNIHIEQHAGINKTTAAIAVKYHWVRIKETVSRVIRDCPQCKETFKAPTVNETREGNKAELEGRQGLLNIDTNLSSGIATSQLIEGSRTRAPPENSNLFASTHPLPVQGPVDTISDYTGMPLDPQIIDIHPHLPRFRQHGAMDDPYTSCAHGLPEAANDYHMMVNDTSDTESGVALRQETLRLVNSQANEVHQEQDMLAKYEYVERSEDELDFT